MEDACPFPIGTTLVHTPDTYDSAECLAYPNKPGENVGMLNEGDVIIFLGETRIYVEDDTLESSWAYKLLHNGTLFHSYYSWTELTSLRKELKKCYIRLASDDDGT